jgi:hypothetical protein
MEAISIEVVNPKAKNILQNLAELNLIRIKPQATLSEMLVKLRKNEADIPSLEEITNEVETVREIRHAKKHSITIDTNLWISFLLSKQFDFIDKLLEM